MLMHDLGQENTGTKTTDIRCNISCNVDNRRQWTSNWNSNIGTEGYRLLRKEKKSGRVIIRSTIMMGN